MEESSKKGYLTSQLVSSTHFPLILDYLSANSWYVPSFLFVKTLYFVIYIKQIISFSAVTVEIIRIKRLKVKFSSLRKLFPHKPVLRVWLNLQQVNNGSKFHQKELKYWEEILHPLPKLQN